MTSFWYGALENMAKDLFNGDDTSVDRLQSLLSEGKMITGDPTVPLTSVETKIESAMYAYLIPQAWSLSNEEVYPFIVDSGFDCAADNPLSQYIDDEDAQTSWVCHENKLYYLMAAKGASRSCGPENNCGNLNFSPVPGLLDMDGVKFGGVTKENIVLG
jgi:hypothetical protein